jgi:hypothetical protein
VELYKRLVSESNAEPVAEARGVAGGGLAPAVAAAPKVELGFMVSTFRGGGSFHRWRLRGVAARRQWRHLGRGWWADGGRC